MYMQPWGAGILFCANGVSGWWCEPALTACWRNTHASDVQTEAGSALSLRSPPLVRQEAHLLLQF